MTSTPTRIPEEVATQARALAQAQGRQVGEVIAEAWRMYFAANKDEFAANLERSAALIRDGDVQGLADHMNHSSRR